MSSLEVGAITTATYSIILVLLLLFPPMLVFGLNLWVGAGIIMVHAAFGK